MSVYFWRANLTKITDRLCSLINDGSRSIGSFEVIVYSPRFIFFFLFSPIFSRLARSTLILLPLFSIHYFFFLWNTKPLLIPHLILIHLTVHTISSSLQVESFSFIECVLYNLITYEYFSFSSQGFMVAMIYTFLNGEVQRELFRSIDRWLIGHYATWQPPRYLRDYIHKLDNEHFHSWPYSIPSSSRVNSLRSSNDHRIYQHIHQARNSSDQCQISMNEISNRT